MRTIAYVQYPEYLEHHGILGQKWGQQNGPPYPIKEGDHSAAEKKANPGLGSKLKSGISNVQNAIKARQPVYRREHYEKNPRNITSEELEKRIKRLRQEEEYIKLMGGKTPAQKRAIRMAKGKQFTDALFKKLGERVGSTGEDTWKNFKFLANTLISAPFRATKFVYTELGSERKKQRYDSKKAAEESRQAYINYMKSLPENKQRDAEEDFQLFAEAQAYVNEQLAYTGVDEVKWLI